MALPRMVRCSALLAGCAGGAAGTWLLARDPLLALCGPLRDRGPGGLADLPLQTVLVGGCALALVACALWLLLCTGLLLASYAAGWRSPCGSSARVLGRLAERGCPVLVRQAVAAALGVAVTAGAAGPAMANPAMSGPGPGAPGRDPTGAVCARLTGLSLPDRSTGSAMTAEPPRTLAPRPVPRLRAVVVAPGDSLWSIAAGLLPVRADAGDITSAWHRLHHANRARVGSDPDLILPGTRLTVPDLTAPERKELP